jgi:hypothetical protein
MIDTRSIKEESVKFPDPLKSIIELSKDKMPEQDFIDFFISLRKKARKMDTEEMKP